MQCAAYATTDKIFNYGYHESPKINTFYHDNQCGKYGECSQSRNAGATSSQPHNVSARSRPQAETFRYINIVPVNQTCVSSRKVKVRSVTYHETPSHQAAKSRPREGSG